MGKDSKIAWTDHTFNPWWGCTKVSAGCKHCYAETFSNRLGGNWWGDDADRRFFGDKHWNDPVRWNRKAEKEGVRYKVFCGSMCDIFEHRKDLAEAQDRLFSLIDATSNLDWLLLTKRSENILLIVPANWQWPNNVWMGTTVENQEQADIRIPKLLKVPAKIYWLSIEPMLGPVDLGKWLFSSPTPDIHWPIVGGESGTGARPMQIEWARSVRDQCVEAGVPFFMKQLGGHPDKRKEMDDFPEDLRIREFPNMVTMYK